MSCKFCSDEKQINILSEFDKIEMSINQKYSTLVINKKSKKETYDFFTINYCPICGKELPQK